MKKKYLILLISSLFISCNNNDNTKNEEQESCISPEFYDVLRGYIHRHAIIIGDGPRTCENFCDSTNFSVFFFEADSSKYFTITQAWNPAEIRYLDEFTADYFHCNKEYVYLNVNGWHVFVSNCIDGVNKLYSICKDQKENGQFVIDNYRNLYRDDGSRHAETFRYFDDDTIIIEPLDKAIRPYDPIWVDIQASLEKYK